MFERSEITKALVRYLQPFDKGTRLSYAELSAAAGTPITSDTTALITARHILQRDHNAVWGCITPRVGLWRLDDGELVVHQREWWLRGARNKLRAGSRQAEVIELSALDISQQARFATDSIIREIAREALSKTTQRRVERVARGTSNNLPVFSAVEWMIALTPTRRKRQDAQAPA